MRLSLETVVSLFIEVDYVTCTVPFLLRNCNHFTSDLCQVSTVAIAQFVHVSYVNSTLTLSLLASVWSPPSLLGEPSSLCELMDAISP